MKIALSATGPSLDAMIDPRFGRATYLLIVETDTGELVESIDNSSRIATAKGAGIGAAALMANKGVQAILTGRIGPKAMPIVDKAQIQVVSNVNGPVQTAIQQFSGNTGTLPSIAGSGEPNLPSGAVPENRPATSRGCGGGGRGRGMGGGQGVGRGMKRGGR